MKSIYKTVGYTTILSTLIALAPLCAQANEVDFSCMKEQVRPIIQVTDQHQEFDLVIRNQCPGSVHWAMCIERLDPWTHRVLETHTPTGYVEAEKKARVNLQMKATQEPGGEENRAQEFYMSVAYSIEAPARAACVAGGCEAKKTEIRAEAARNRKAWQKARKDLEAKTIAECPDHGWNTDDTDACRQAVIDAAAESMAGYRNTDKELRDRLAAINPETCEVYGGSVLKLNKS